ncbi:MAG: rhomboid family intramembrane serine protease [Coriobacteriia bacterium]|nr:rhomboid family intramembrane serine protease [Coriobacteriia bacterium]
MFFILPYRIDRAFKMPWATIGLIVLNTVVFSFSVSIGLEWTIATLGFRMGPWAPLTWLSASFLHADPLHLLGNMYFLWLFGSIVEDALGPRRLVAVYIVGGLVAAISHGVVMLAFVPGAADIPMIGASGALAAIMGLFAVRFYRTKIRVGYFVWFVAMIRYGTFAISSVAGVVLWFARDVVSGLIGIGLGAAGGVANWAHLGGVVFGVAIGLLSGQIRSASTEYLADDAHMYAATGTHEIAAAKYAELAEQDPQNPEWRRRKARELANAIAAAPGSASAEYGHAIRLYVQGRRMPEALDTFIEADGRLGTLALDHPLLLALAAEAERRSDWPTAERLYLHVADERGGTPAAEKAVFRLAHVYLGMEDRERAQATWEHFGDLHPSSEWMAFADPALRALRP